MVHPFPGIPGVVHPFPGMPEVVPIVSNAMVLKDVCTETIPEFYFDEQEEGLNSGNCDSKLG